MSASKNQQVALQHAKKPRSEGANGGRWGDSSLKFHELKISNSLSHLVVGYSDHP